MLVAEVDSYPHPVRTVTVPDVQDTDHYTKARERHTRRTEVTDVGIRWEPVALRIIENWIPFQATKTTLFTIEMQANLIRLLETKGRVV